MIKNNCGIVRDLLPLYAENMCSEESRKAVAEHLSECSECRNELNKINTNIVIQVDSDISAFKRIKKRARIEKLIIGIVSAAVILIIGWFVYFFLVNTDCTMDYEKFGIAENVRIEEDKNGDLWLCKKDDATSADFFFPILSDKNGNLTTDDDFDKNNTIGYGFTLKHRRIDSLAILPMPCPEERTLLFNINEKKLEYVFYYDDTTDTEYVLWERNK